MSIIFIYLIFLVSGLGYTELLAKSFIRNSLLGLLVISPIIGACILMLGSGILALDTKATSQFFIFGLLVITISIILFSWMLLRRTLSRLYGYIENAYCLLSVDFICFLIALLIVGSLLQPMDGESLTVRLGIDLPAYASATSTLVGHSTNEVATVFSNEVLHHAHRWGLPSLSAFVYMLLPFETDLYSILYGVTFSLLVSGVCSVAYIFQVLYCHFAQGRSIRKSYRVTFIISTLMLINSASMNFLHEGFYPQIVSTALVGLSFSIFLIARNHDEADRSILFLFAILLGAMSFTYSEALILSLAVLTITLFVDLIIKNGRGIKVDFLFLCGFLFAMIIGFPVTKDLVNFTVANTGNMTSVGYTQPNFMFPSEIVGVGTIYANARHFFDDAVATHFVSRKYPVVFFAIISSWLTSYLFLRGAKVLKEKSFATAVVVILLGIFFLNYTFTALKLMPAGYVYNKLSSILAPLIFGMLAIGLLDWSYKDKKEWKLVTFFIVLSISLTCFFTIKDLGTFSTRVNPKELVALDAHLDNCHCILLPMERGYRDGALVGKLRYVDRTAETIMASILETPMIDQWNLSSINSLDGKTHIFLLYDDSRECCSDGKFFMGEEIQRVGQYHIIDLKLNLDDFKGKKGEEGSTFIQSFYARFHNLY